MQRQCHEHQQPTMSYCVSVLVILSAMNTNSLQYLAMSLHWYFFLCETAVIIAHATLFSYDIK